MNWGSQLRFIGSSQHHLFGLRVGDRSRLRRASSSEGPAGPAVGSGCDASRSLSCARPGWFHSEDIAVQDRGMRDDWRLITSDATNVILNVRYSRNAPRRRHTDPRLVVLPRVAFSTNSLNHPGSPRLTLSRAHRSEEPLTVALRLDTPSPKPATSHDPDNSGRRLCGGAAPRDLNQPAPAHGTASTQ
jgi:hypothetical protein